MAAEHTRHATKRMTARRPAALALLAFASSACASEVADWRYFAAGGVSAALSHGYTTPIDVVKTMMQMHPELGTSVTDAARSLVRSEGVSFLFQGFAATCTGYGVEGALKFGCYEIMKTQFAHLTPNRAFNYLCASVVAGEVAALVLCPAEEVRIKQVSDPHYCEGGTIDTLRKISAENGPLATFEGMPAMAAKQVPYTMGKQVSFDVACECVRGLFRLLLRDEGAVAALNGIVPMIAAIPAAVLACVMSHPGDMLLTSYYHEKQGHDGRSRSVISTARDLISHGGIAALFRGLRARLLHVISIIWVQLVVYDKTKQLLGLPATGGH